MAEYQSSFLLLLASRKAVSIHLTGGYILCYAYPLSYWFVLWSLRYKLEGKKRAIIKQFAH